MSGRGRRTDFTENLEAVARGVRRLEEIRDPILREAVAVALRLREREFRVDPVSRIRMRNTVLAALAPARPTAAERAYGIFAIIGMPAPMLVRALVIVVLIAGLLGGATVASADSLPDEPLYAFKLAGEQLRLAIAVSAEDRACVEMSIAEHRLDEAERLASSGREDDAIIATADYGSSLADAAADLASVETSDPGTAALVSQLQTSITLSQQRVADTATRLAADPRTASTAEVLATVSATAAPSTVSPATRIADQAVAITAKLWSVADDRANLADPERTDADTATSSPRPIGSASARPSARGSAPATDRTTATPTVRTAQTAPANVSAARQSAERAKEAAQRALRAAEKAKRATFRTPSPSPTRR
ncbi:MAG TPA: hypothetical protein DCK98_15435 [Chloroflexi bacterium]|nr:hypothetical protein [Chloroflexota bacterium]HAL29005.1 hypothetical protein [Chloroflexota bacterium]